MKVSKCYVSCLVVNAVTTITHSNNPGTGNKDIWLSSRSQATFTRYRTNFRPVVKFDRIFCSHRTVQCFRSVLTVVSPSVHAQSATLPTDLSRIDATTRFAVKNLDGRGVHTTLVKFSTAPEA